MLPFLGAGACGNRAQLFLVVSHAFAKDVLEIEEGAAGIDFDFAFEIIDFVGYNSESE